MKKNIISIAVAIFFYTSFAFCADGFYVIPVKGDSTVKVMKTGQTTFYATGDDGDLQRGATIPNPRFTDNVNGTITDNLTKLVWLENAYVAGVARLWATALTDVAQLNTDGTMNGNDCGDTSKGGTHQTDWRLPNRNELASLIDSSNYNLALPTGHPFTSVQTGSYWSGTTYAYDTDLAWGVPMYTGLVYYYDKSNSTGCYFWPVRAGND